MCEFCVVMVVSCLWVLCWVDRGVSFEGVCRALVLKEWCIFGLLSLLSEFWRSWCLCFKLGLVCWLF